VAAPEAAVADPFRLDGCVALVTGGAGGIGAAIARQLARAGARVAVTLHGSTEFTLGKRAGDVWPIRAELTQPDAASVLTRAVEQGLGPVDILVNNAGSIRRADAEHSTEEDWQAVLDINLNAVWRLSQHIGQGMLERGHGKIINVASLLSFQGGVRVPAYAASKHALAGLTKALANEWAGRGVNVNAVAPGYVETANTEALRQDPARAAQILARIPAGRWATPDDVAGAAVFLASGASDYVHGHVLVVDGGWLAR